MNALRQIIDQKGQDLHIHLPDEFADQRLEVLIVPSVDAADEKAPQRQASMIKETAGLLKGQLPDGISFQNKRRQEW